MWMGYEKNYKRREFLTPPAKWKQSRNLPTMPTSERRPRSSPHSFHVIHKVPAGDSPYVKAKHVQLIEKDPGRAISLFWASINAGDRVESSLKDMAVVMKQLDRSEEAIEAIKSFRHLCPPESHDSLDNVLLELYKSSGRIQEQIEMLQLKLKHIEEGMTYGGNQTRIARSQGRKVQITIEKEYSRLLGNLAWVFMQQKDYKSAEESYRKALSLEPDKNKQCNLAICLIHMNKIAEARFLLRTVQCSADNGVEESYAKSFERAIQMIDEIEIQSTGAVGLNTIPQNKSFCFNTKCSVVSYLTGKNKAGAYESSPFQFTQPRRSQVLQCSSSSNHGGEAQSSSATTGNCDNFSRKLYFEKTVGPLESHSFGAEEDCPQGPSNIRRSLELREIIRNSMENLKATQNLDESNPMENNKATQHFDESHKLSPHIILLREGSKKSWADMVEEDYEQENQQCAGKYDQGMPSEYPREGYPFYRTPNRFSEWCKGQQLNDENADSNVIVDSEKKDAEKTKSSPSDDPECGGYYTQPEKYVRRSLTFPDQQYQSAADDKQILASSPLEKKVLNMDTYASVLSGGGCSSSLKGVGVKLLSRNSRLQVFRDITPESPKAS